MIGIWLKRSEGSAALGISPYEFDKKATDFKSKPSLNGKATLYFVPASELTDKAQKNMSARFTELPSDDVADIVEGILGDVTGQTFAATVEDQLQEARLANVKARTAMLGEKLERRKTELFNEWSMAFFEAFAEAFTKFKNELIALQLNEKQLSTLQEKLSLALQSLKDKLDFLETDYGKDDKEEDDLLNNGEK